MHCCSRNVKLRIARRVISCGITAIALWMASFNASIICGFPRKTSDFRCPQRKKSQGERSGEWAGHGMSPCNETRRPGNSCPRTPREILAEEFLELYGKEEAVVRNCLLRWSGQLVEVPGTPLFDQCFCFKHITLFYATIGAFFSW